MRRRNNLTAFELLVIVVLGLILAFYTYKHVLPYLNNAWHNLTKQETTIEKEENKDEEINNKDDEEKTYIDITIKVECEAEATIILSDIDNNQVEAGAGDFNSLNYSVNPGTYVVEVTAEGYEDYREELEITAEDIDNENIITILMQLKETGGEA